MAIRRLNPEYSEELTDGWELRVPEAGRKHGGFTEAEIFIANGEVKGNQNVKLGDPASKQAFAELVAEKSGGKITVAAVLDRLPGLSYAVQEMLTRMEDEDSAGGSEEGAGNALDFADVEPWSDPVDGEALIQEMSDRIERYCLVPKGASQAIALWIMHTYLIDANDFSPILHITSPQPQCGKSRLLALLTALCYRPFAGTSLTPATVYRVIEKWHPTLLIDEADAFMDGKEDLRCILNNGWFRPLAKVPRCVPPDNEVVLFSTWAPKAFAGIGGIANTLEDRSIQIMMSRKKQDENVEAFRMDKAMKEAEPLRRKALRWAIDNFDAVRDAEPDVPDWLDDRQADNWRVLCSIAEVAGQSSLKKTMTAMVDLLGKREAKDENDGIMLLRDLQKALDKTQHGRITSEKLVEYLHDTEDGPWNEYGRMERPITKRQVAKLLKPFGIKPGTVRDGSGTAKGYKVEDCQDAFIRYIPPSQSVTPSQPSNDAGKRDFPNVTPDPHVTDEKTEKPAPVLDCYGVTDTKGVSDEINAEEGYVEELF